MRVVEARMVALGWSREARLELGWMRAMLRAVLRGLTWQFLSVRLAFWSTKIPKSPPVIFKPSNTATCAGMESIGNRKTLVSVQHAAAAAEPRSCHISLRTSTADLRRPHGCRRSTWWRRFVGGGDGRERDLSGSPPRPREARPAGGPSVAVKGEDLRS